MYVVALKPIKICNIYYWVWMLFKIYKWGVKIYKYKYYLFFKWKMWKMWKSIQIWKEDITKHKKTFYTVKYYPSSDCSFYEYFINFHTFMNTIRLGDSCILFRKNLHSPRSWENCCSLILHLTIDFLKLSFIISAKRLLDF